MLTRLLFVVLLVFAFAPTASAGEWAYGAADHVCCGATATNFLGVSDRKFNSTGAGVTAERLGVGLYTMTFQNITGVGAGGHVQVTATQSTVWGPTHGRYCKPLYWWAHSAGTTVGVQCYDHLGNPQEGGFIAMYISDPTPHSRLAYAWAHAPTSTAPYTPIGVYAENGSGAIQIQRTSVGRYDVRLYGQTGSGGTVAVSPYGWTNHRCHVGSWARLSDHTRVRVRCNRPSAAPADSAFTVLYARELAPIRHLYLDNLGAYGWANNPTAANYIPMTLYQWDQTYGITMFDRIRIRRSAAGRYQIDVPGSAGATYPVYLVTPYGSDDDINCEATGSAPNEGVNCHDGNGNIHDARFTFQMLTPTAFF